MFVCVCVCVCVYSDTVCENIVTMDTKNGKRAQQLLPLP